VKVESLILFMIGLFFGAIAIVYWFTSYEDAGSLMLIGSTLLGLFPAAYYWFWHRKMRERPRAEDLPDATVESGAGVISSFPSTSIWPFVLGMGAFLIALGLVFGAWLTAMGIGLVLSAVTGVTLESRRGGNV
jgi:hypothetical protein